MPAKFHLVKAMVFPVVVYGCESWTIEKAERWRIDAFELWFWRRLSRVPWTSRRSNQSILKEINPGCSLEGLMLKLKLQYLGHLMRRVDSFEKTLMLGKIEGRRRRGQQRMRWLDGITNLRDIRFGWTPGIGDGQGGLVCCGSRGHKESDPTEQLNWTEHVWIWELDYKESWAPKNQCFWTVLLEKILEGPLDIKEIKLVHPKRNQSWILIGRTDDEAPILWLPDVKNWFTGKDPGTGKDWRRKE